MSEIHLPEEFIRLSRWFHQDIWIIYKDVESIVRDSIQEFDDAELKTLEEFFKSALDNYTGQQLIQLWSRSSSDIFLKSDKGAIEFWKRIYSALLSTGR